MKYDFTTQIDRKSAGSDKWKNMYNSNPNVEEGILPLSMADMEFKNAPEIYEGLKKFIESEPILGYSSQTDEFLATVVDWQAKRHDWKIEKDWIINTPGVVAAISTAIQAFSEEDDGVIIFRPVYMPFGLTIGANNRQEVNVPLLEEDGYYTIDFKAFEEAAAKAENKILIFCSPHNPVGRVWTVDELEKIAEIALAHDLYIISDEIWYDFTEPGQTHTVFHKVEPKLADRIITCTSPSKTFNLAGTALSNIIISNPETRAAFNGKLMTSFHSANNIFGYEAARIAYTKATPWFEELLNVITHNKKIVHNFFQENYPKIKAPISEGTYIQWLDFRNVALDDAERKTLLNQHQIFTDAGTMFGQEGSGYERINVALPEEILVKSLERLVDALKTVDF